MINVMLLKNAHPEAIGLIPYFLNESDPRPAAEQFGERYAHGGGWRAMKGWKMLGGHCIKYPGDPKLEPIAVIKLRDELITIYGYGFVSIIDRDGKFEVARMD